MVDYISHLYIHDEPIARHVQLVIVVVVQQPVRCFVFLYATVVSLVPTSVSNTNIILLIQSDNLPQNN